MKVIISILIYVVAFLFLSDIKITYKPFTVSLPNWVYAAGFFLILIGVMVIGYNSFRKGYNKAIDDVETILQQKREEAKHESTKN